MNAIKLQLNPQGRGAFYIEDQGERIAFMEISIVNGQLTVFHTEVAEKLKGQGIATKLVEHMVKYARENNLKVVPLCPYVLAQFKRHPDTYADIWKKDWHG
jgi:predicted GNAT family acetyltransferase